MHNWLLYAVHDCSRNKKMSLFYAIIEIFLIIIRSAIWNDFKLNATIYIGFVFRRRKNQAKQQVFNAQSLWRMYLDNQRLQATGCWNV